MGADQKRKEARKRKFGAQAGAADADSNPAIAILVSDGDIVEQPHEKKQKKSSQCVETPAESATVETEAAEDEAAETSPLDDQEKTSQEITEKKAQRFIVFIGQYRCLLRIMPSRSDILVGNLPFTATDDSIAKHFAKVHPKSIRHRTDKEKGKSKGFAFLEFEGYDRMKTCLKLYHHSDFDDGESPARRLNVELTYV